jgi:hypothetical protein
MTILFGSFAFAFAILEFSLPERVYIHWMEMQEGARWFLALPYLWGIGMIFALTIGYFVFSKTGKNYRYHASALAGILILGSLTGGQILYVSRVAHWGQENMLRFTPRYK